MFFAGKRKPINFEILTREWRSWNDISFYRLSTTFYDFLCGAKFWNTFLSLILREREFIDTPVYNLTLSHCGRPIWCTVFFSGWLEVLFHSTFVFSHLWRRNSVFRNLSLQNMTKIYHIEHKKQWYFHRDTFFNTLAVRMLRISPSIVIYRRLVYLFLTRIWSNSTLVLLSSTVLRFRGAFKEIKRKKIVTKSCGNLFYSACSEGWSSI